jgi:hypothetical protein
MLSRDGDPHLKLSRGLPGAGAARPKQIRKKNGQSEHVLALATQGSTIAGSAVPEWDGASQFGKAPGRSSDQQQERRQEAAAPCVLAALRPAHRRVLPRWCRGPL